MDTADTRVDLRHIYKRITYGNLRVIDLINNRWAWQVGKAEISYSETFSGRQDEPMSSVSATGTT